MTVILQEYRARRNFDETREPSGASRQIQRLGSRQTFVVQKHDASRLHYDFRLRMGGVLKSWAIPKGIPTDQGERRLAKEVEDHPVEYGKFEGVIPAGNYGAGTVQLWDHGKYEMTGDSPAAGWRKGKLSFVLHGKKLKGHWTLVRLRRDNESDKSWLLIKTVESLHGLSAKEANRSVASGKTMAEISRGRRVWKSAPRARRDVQGTFKARIQKVIARRNS
jgi:bifunctional non-homologous end joining protein LigD